MFVDALQAHNVNLYQRCEYSDLPFARISWHTAGLRKGLEGVVPRGQRGSGRKLTKIKHFELDMKHMCQS